MEEIEVLVYHGTTFSTEQSIDVDVANFNFCIWFAKYLLI